MAAVNTDIRARVEEMVEFIQSGRIIEAMDEFYAPDAEMQENRKPPTKGLEANIEREKQFLAQVKSFKGFGASAIGVDGDIALIESWMEFVNTDDQPARLEQVSVQRWKNGRITHERFYYDSAG